MFQDSIMITFNNFIYKVIKYFSMNRFIKNVCYDYLGQIVYTNFFVAICI